MGARYESIDAGGLLSSSTWHPTSHVRQWEAGKRNYDGTAQSSVAFQGWRRGGEGGTDAPNGLIQISFALSFAGSALCSKKSR
ncbi:hypothetical protein CEXT_363561 [Caerostris extrusa]|uniref:Uncharacterized protein n=1 Tax=Caerostris extrusa TaxID=172846 RepID=A0AAV4SVW9_CAEEX|nr:hypothetical protein CEXT_363561 [Caerostris extrusa]